MAWLYSRPDGQVEPVVTLNQASASDRGSWDETPLYTHADPGEVERLRTVIEQQKNLIASLRAELVESRSIDASAEPSAAAESIPEGYCLMPRRLTAENGAKPCCLASSSWR